jgi:uncharacterized membrane protein YgaE (UPF0421/DUF939 family)
MLWLDRLGITRSILLQSARATIAAVASMLLAQVFKLDEYYWAPISAIVIILSTINPRAVGWQRFVGTALGAAIGAVIASHFRPTWIVYGIAIFVSGIISALARAPAAYRFTAITLTIVLLIAHESTPWVVALHRFIEVSIGIGVALVVAEVWPLPSN